MGSSYFAFFRSRLISLHLFICGDPNIGDAMDTPEEPDDKEEVEDFADRVSDVTSIET